MGARSRRLARMGPARRAPTCRSRSTVGPRDGRVERPPRTARGRSCVVAPFEDRVRGCRGVAGVRRPRAGAERLRRDLPRARARGGPRVARGGSPRAACRGATSSTTSGTTRTSSRCASGSSSASATRPSSSCASASHGRWSNIGVDLRRTSGAATTSSRPTTSSSSVRRRGGARARRSGHDGAVAKASVLRAADGWTRRSSCTTRCSSVTRRCRRPHEPWPSRGRSSSAPRASPSSAGWRRRSTRAARPPRTWRTPTSRSPRSRVRARVNEAIFLGRLGENDAALAIYEEILDAAGRRRRRAAGRGRAPRLRLVLADGRQPRTPDEALNCLRETIARFEDVRARSPSLDRMGAARVREDPQRARRASTTPSRRTTARRAARPGETVELREWIADALLRKGDFLRDAGDRAGAIAAYRSVFDRFSLDPEGDLPRLAAGGGLEAARLSHGFLRFDRSLELAQAIVARFGGSADAEVRERVAVAEMIVTALAKRKRLLGFLARAGRARLACLRARRPAPPGRLAQLDARCSR